MSTTHRTYLNGVELGGVLDLPARVINLNYDRDKNTVVKETNIGQLKLSREINQALLDYIQGGITGTTPGALEGAAYKEEVERGGVIETIFDGYVDLTDDHLLSPITSEIRVKEKNSMDFLNDVIDGFTYEYLHAIGEITNDDFIWMPYVLNSVPDYLHSALALLSTFTVEQQLESTVEHISELGTSMTNPFEATAVIRMILFIAYLAALFIAIIKLIKDTVQLLIQPVKYHACMYLKTLLEKGAAHLGYIFESPVFDNPDWAKRVIMPEKQYVARNTTDNRLYGFTNPDNIDQYGYFKGTFGDVLRIFKQMIKGKVVIQGNKIIAVRRDQPVGTPAYQLAWEGDSNYYQPAYKLNTDEFVSNYLIAFQTDPSEKNTIQEYLGTEYQVITEPLTVDDVTRKLMKGLYEERIPLALAKRKEELTVPEKIIDKFLDAFDGIVNAVISAINVVIDAVNTLIKIINKIIKALKVVGIKVNWEIPSIPTIDPLNLGDLIDNRIGMLKIEYDQFDVPKIFILNKGSQSKYNKLDADNATKVTAKSLWDGYHKVESFVPSPEFPFGNQCRIFHYTGIPFVFANYQQVKQCNTIFDHDGNEGEMDGLDWTVLPQKADAVARFPYIWSCNLTQRFLEPDGR